MALFSIGDAILKFVADTTELDQSFDKIQSEAAAKLAPVQAEANAVGQAFNEVTQSAQTAAASMGEVGIASDKASASYLRLAQATAANQQAQQSVRIALANVRQTGGDSAKAIDLLAAAQQKAAITSKELAEAQAALKLQVDGVAASEKAAGLAAETMGLEAAAGAEVAAAGHGGLRAQIGILDNTIRGAHSMAMADLIRMNANSAVAMKLLPIAATAASFVVMAQIIVEVAEKLSQFIADTYIYTDAMKQQYAQQIELNKAILDQTNKLDDLKKAYDRIGLSGTALLKSQIAETTGEIWKQEAAYAASAAQVGQLTKELEDLRQKQLDASRALSASSASAGAAGGLVDLFAPQIADVQKRLDAANDAVALSNAKLNTLRQQQKNQNKEIEQGEVKDVVQNNQAIIDADKTTGDARIALLQAGSKLRLLIIKAGYSDQIAEEQRFAEMKYQLELNTLKRELANLQLDPTKNTEQIRAKNAQIEALEAQHQANLIGIYTKGLAALKNAVAQAASVTESSKILDSIAPPPDSLAARLQKLSDLLSQFGIKSDQTLIQEADNTEKAFEKIAEAYSKGEASIGEYLQMEEKLYEANRKLAGARGEVQAVKAYGEALDAVRKQLVELGIETDNGTKKQDRWNISHKTAIDYIDKWALDMRKTRGELTQTQQAFDAIIGQTTQAFGSAIEAWILGQESLGRALRSALAQEAATIAARAVMWGLYYTAWGIADLFWNPGRAGADFASAAEFFAVAGIAGGFAAAINPGRASTGGQQQAPQTQAAEGIQQGPVQTQNVQRFATGGLISGPTLAIIGDAVSSSNNSSATLAGSGSREAVLPLDHPESLRQIGSAIAAHMPNGGTVIQVDGLISDDNLIKVVKKIDRLVKRNDVKLTSSNTFKITSKIGRSV